jgi:hypothetical protein
MGGNVFKGETTRLTKAEYREVVESTTKLLKQFPIKFEVILSYRDKESFGDLDIIYHSIKKDYNFVEDFLDKVQPNLFYKNGDVLSAALPCSVGLFQVDLIRVKKETFNFSYHYFNYNDLGNFLGRIYHKAGFKLGHEGLKYVVRVDTHVLAELLVTPYWMAAMQFAGYDRYFVPAYNTVRDIFEFALSSPYANKDIYLLENRNHTSRVRDRKRKNYSMLLQFLQDPETQCANFDWSDKDKHREEFLQKAFDRFPSFKKEYDEVFDEVARKAEFKKKFNGSIVGEVTGLSGKELGEFIQGYKEFLGCNFENHIVGSTPEQIAATMSVYKNSWFIETK